MSKLDTKIINEELEKVFNKFDSAAKVNLALLNVKTADTRYYFAHENLTLLFKKPPLLCKKNQFENKPGKIEKFDIVEQCIQERQTTKWRFKLITNVTVFAALIKNIPLGCPDSVVPEFLLRHTQVNCLLSDKDN